MADLDLSTGTIVVVRPMTGGAQGPYRGRVAKTSGPYAWIAIDGQREHVRVAKRTGRGTVAATEYEVTPADDATLAEIDHRTAAEAIRTSVFELEALFALSVRQRLTPRDVFVGEDAARLRSLADSLREIVSRARQTISVR